VLDLLLKNTAAALVVYPLVMSVLIVASPRRDEKFISRLVFFGNLANGILTVALLALFILSGFKSVEISYGNLISLADYHFRMLLLIDKYSVSCQTLIGILTGLVLMFSRRYMHREEGYLRFFASLFLFVSGISLVSLAATIDMLFAGWEVVGISSFLLIGFYRIRLQPGRNSLRAYAIYRFCDLGLFLEAWLFHKLGNEFFFLQYADRPMDPALIQAHEGFFIIGAILIVIAAMGKSAQYPFSFWVPRAMEGPTPSSAIFYGALSIHAGVYLLIRLYPLWTAVSFIPWIVGSIGLFTAFTASIALKTQSNVKGQIGYASVAQVGLMFFELALGLREVAMIHFLGNAVLRCYQLLASPSIMVLYLRQQAEGAVMARGFDGFFMRFLSEKMRYRYFAFSFSEGYAEALVVSLWNVLKKFAAFILPAFSPFFFINMLAGLLLIVSFGRPYLGDTVNAICAVVLGTSAVFVALAALGVRVGPKRVLWMTFLSASFKGISAIYLNPEAAIYSMIYFSGIGGGFAIAYLGLRKIPDDVLHTEYAGAATLYPLATNLFFVGALWMSGFTFSPTFFGEDLLLHFGAEKFAFETIFIGAAFVINAVTLMRSYVKLAFAK
jgi:NADH-quinone oxidoreductase subunit L